MNELELFAGAGGGILGSMLLGHRTVCAVEYDAYARSVLLARQNDGTFPTFPVWDDVRTFDGKPWRGIVDCVSGGFPCQAFSKAAAGRNNAENRWPEMLRIIGEIQPSYAFAENVCESAIVMAQSDLEEIGYKTGRIRIDAKDLGADHIRGRWWLFAYADNDGELGGKLNAKTRLLQEIGSFIWEAKPDDSRVDDGLADRTHRLKAIGNGQVPLCKVAAWIILSDDT